LRSRSTIAACRSLAATASGLSCSTATSRSAAEHPTTSGYPPTLMEG
jgi:hypothetical protein